VGWIIAAFGLFLLIIIVRKSVDRETAKSFGLLLKVFVACIVLLVIGVLVASD